MTWLPEVCNQLHDSMTSIFWLLIIPVTTFLIMLELFKTADKQPDAGKIITRAVISIVLLFSFKETINLIAFIGDGIAEKIDGLAKMGEILEVLGEGFNRDAPALYKVREAFIFLINFLSYFLAYFGIFIANAMIHFVWSVLYVCAPLMILCYISEASVSICKSLYRGLLTVMMWKILWSVLSVLLLKLVTEQTTVHSDNAITTAIINICIALSILFIPLFTKSLISDGLSGAAAGYAAVPSAVALKAGKQVLKRGYKRGASVVRDRYQSFKERAPKRELAKKELAKKELYKKANLGVTPKETKQGVKIGKREK